MARSLPLQEPERENENMGLVLNNEMYLGDWFTSYLGQELSIFVQSSECLQYLTAHVAPPVGAVSQEPEHGAMAVRKSLHGLVMGEIE